MVAIEIEGLDRELAEFKGIPTRLISATARSLNRGILTGTTFMARAVAKDTGMKVGDVKKALVVTKASPVRLTATLSTSYKRVPLISFNARGPEPSRGRGRGVSYSLQNGRTTLEHAFIATMQSGHRGVFLRVGKGRLPVRELMGPSLGHVFDKYRAEGERQAEDSFEKNFAHEMDRNMPAPPEDDGAE